MQAEGGAPRRFVIALGGNAILPAGKRGTFAEQVKVICPGDPALDRLVFAGEGLAFQVTGFWDAVLSAAAAGGGSDEAAPMEVICYKIR